MLKKIVIRQEVYQYATAELLFGILQELKEHRK